MAKIRLGVLKNLTFFAMGFASPISLTAYAEEYQESLFGLDIDEALSKTELDSQNSGSHWRDIMFELGLSSRGLYIAGVYDFNDTMPGIAVRLPLTQGSATYDQIDDTSTTISGNFNFDTIGIFADYYPINKSGFRISGGMTSGGYELVSTMNRITNESNVTVLGDFTVSFMEEQSPLPTIAMGYSQKNKDLGLFFDLSMRLSSWKVSVDGPALDRLSNEEKQTVDNFIAEYEQTLDAFVPSAAFGILFRL